jgi:hypothetical protein
VAALLARELVLEVHARRAGFDHLLHQLERIERTAEACLGVSDDRREPVHCARLLEMLDLVRALQRLVDGLTTCGAELDG